MSYAAIVVRGLVGIKDEDRDTLTMLKLKKKHTAILIKENPVNLGMLAKVKDIITYGPVSETVAKKLEAKMKNGVVHLAPPRGGFERKGIKQPYAAGGALGKRESMDKILEKML